MQRLACIILFALLGACEGTSAPSDGSIGDAGPPAFEVRLERSMGVPIDDGFELAVEYGCQGGAHVLFDVVAIGAGLDNAQVSATALGREPFTLTMTATPSGAEYRYLMLVLADFVAPGGLGLPRDEVVRVSVRRRDGARVVVDRPVRLIDGEVCSVACQYADVPGTARITAIEGPGTSGCDAGEVTIGYDFLPDGGEPDLGHTQVELLPFDCLSAMGLSVGADVPATRQELLPGTGTCTPFLYTLVLDRDACAAACPAP